MANYIDDSVTSWLWDIRHAAETECMSILLSKPILPPRNAASPTSSVYAEQLSKCSGRAASRTAQRYKKIGNRKPEIGVVRPTRIIRETDEELILGGRIQVGQCDSDNSANSASESVGCGRSPSDRLAPAVRKPQPCRNPQKPIQAQQAVNNGCLSPGHSEAPSELKDSLLSSSSSTSEDSSLPVRTYDSNAPNGPKFLQTRPTEQDASSLDSACGSSPDYQGSHDHSPVNRISQFGSPSSLPSSVIASTHRAGIPFVPAYSELKGQIERILNGASQVYAHLGQVNRSASALQKSTLRTVEDFVSVVESSGIQAFIPYEESLTAREFCSLRRQEWDKNCIKAFDELIRHYTEKVLYYVAKVILRNMAENGPLEPSIPNALEKLAHVCLFGERISLNVIQTGAVNYLLHFCRQKCSSLEVIRLSLRVLAVLCSVSKGCVQLLSLGGLELIVHLLCASPFESAVEAAGVLTQLTAPCHSFAALPSSLPNVVSRLLDLCDECKDPERYLLCTAALANLSLQHSSVSEQLYKHNAVLRLSRAFQKNVCQSIFVQDQLATILARLSANGYDQAVIAQGGMGCLLELLQVHDTRHEELSRRISYKAAICLGTIASHGFGLKALHENDGSHVLRNVVGFEEEQDLQKRNPVDMICRSLLDRLISKHQLETAV